ncbi:MAG: type II toxin-antitoxin system HicB family antitoxin [Actinomycetota bacterium]|nr:type II toxin-antitoxin system HicB family antitoxin [Actinomycetota bacterium]
MSEYLVVVERAEGNFSAYLPDLPGCVTTGDTREETLALMQDAIALHLKGLQEDGLPIPAATSSAEYLAVAI